MIKLTQQNGEPLHVARHHIVSVRPALGTREFPKCKAAVLTSVGVEYRVKDAPRDVLSQISPA